YYQVMQRNGRRWSAYRAWLEPAMRRPNLTLRTDCTATRLTLADGRAQGIRYRRAGIEEHAQARREVILTAGAIQSPHLMELSGIGDPQVLAQAGLPVCHALPGVGANYQDHYATRMNWRVTQPVTLNEQTRGWRLLRAVAQYLLTRRGILTLATGMAHGFVRTRPELETPDVQYFFVHASYANAADRVLDKRPGMTIGVTQLRPRSRGHIHAVSPDPLTPPRISPRFLTDDVDCETFAAGMRMAREIMAQAPMRAYLGEEMNPGPDCSKDADLIAFARATGQTIYHPVGTCAMGEGPGAVVDPRLRVHGLAGLRIADAAVMPHLVSANTQAAVMMIAEKAADMILADARSG
ncbi:GMC family oxidoreductase, partial [Saliniramus sp.]|uniref:GMC family oxidoreductase n=1 Tax=Saliniramus sp. TaxID=2986772 RepID=UPI002C5D457C